MQGIFINGKRPKSKKQIRESLQSQSDKINLEATSLFNNERDGSILEMSPGESVLIVGPDPYTDRRFYAKLIRRNDGSFKLE